MAGGTVNLLGARELFSESADDPKVIVRRVLEKEIDSVSKAVETYNLGISPPADSLVPYVEDSEHLLSASLGHLHLKVRGSNQRGLDVNLEGNLALAAKDSSRLALLTRLSLYLLQTRGRLTRKKQEKKTNVFNMDNNLYLSEGFQMRQEKREFLEGSKELHKAKSLRRLLCNDPEFSARVLQVMSPRLEEVSVDGAGPTHLSILGSMPRLRRLEVDFPSREIPANDLGPFVWNDEPCNDANDDFLDTTRPWRFKTGPPLDGGLVSLKVRLPRQVLFSFIALHRRTLKELIIIAELPSEPGDEVWCPEYCWFCNDMPERLTDLLRRYPMESLRLLELNRHHGYSLGCISKCERQLQAVRKVLGPTVVVRCNRCG